MQRLCGAVRAELSLGERTYRCECGFELDRDLNAARNLLNLLKVPVNDGELGSGQSRTGTPVKRKALAATFAAKPHLAEAGTYGVSHNVRAIFYHPLNDADEHIQSKT